MSTLSFELYVCPRCGDLAVGRKVCAVCGTTTIGTAINVYDVVNSHINDTKSVKQFLTQLSEQYCSGQNSKEILRQRKNSSKEFTRKTWDILKKGKLKVCPTCGHISSVSCFYDNCVCCICGSTYIDSDMNCIKYYGREEYSAAYFTALQEKIRGHLSKSTYNQTLWDNRIETEKDRLPSQIEMPQEMESIPNYGLIPALINSHINIQNANDRVWQICIVFQSYLSHHLMCIENANIDNRHICILQLREFISDVFNVIRLQYFAGQQVAVDMMEKYLSDLDWQLQGQPE